MVKSIFEKEIKEFIDGGGEIKKLPYKKSSEKKFTAQANPDKELETFEDETDYDYDNDGDYTSVYFEGESS